jgi:NAD(P)-dependent dehydrogenase (short-subunit alcohol dehydrogenase family)
MSSGASSTSTQRRPRGLGSFLAPASWRPLALACSATATPAAIERYPAGTPLGRLVTMSEIVDAVAFLLDNGGINGVDLIVDGGWHCR